MGAINNLDKQQAISRVLLSFHTMTLSPSIEAFVCSLYENLLSGGNVNGNSLETISSFFLVVMGRDRGEDVEQVVVFNLWKPLFV